MTIRPTLRRIVPPQVGRLVLFAAIAIVGSFLSTRDFLTAQTQLQVLPNGVMVGTAYHYDSSLPLRDMPPTPLFGGEEHEANENPKIPIYHADSPDPVVQGPSSPAPSPNMPAPILNFDGMAFPGSGCNCAPPDTNGEVGNTQYVQLVNKGFQVFNKTTGASVFGPVGIGTIWGGFGGVCETSGAGDPVVMYDQLADRWLVSQFAGSGTITDECIAISQTSDATGSYYRYGFHLGSNFFDYPHFAVWPDGYYMAMNIFNASGTAYLGPQPFAFDRSRMLNGLSATFVTPGITVGPSEWTALPADLDGLITPPVGAPATFVEFPGTGTYKSWRFHADFVTPANTTYINFASPVAAGFTELCPTTSSCIPQPGSNFLDGLGDRLMFRLTYRNFGTYEAMVGNHSVSSSGTAGIRWFELRNVTSGSLSVFQQSTYQPDTTSRWMGSAAQDHKANLAVGFSASSAVAEPSVRYAGRLVSDPLNALSQGEATLFNGTGHQTLTGNRWGDYSDLTVDPIDDCTYYYTQEYYAVTGQFNWRTRVGSFKFPGCLARRPAADFDRDFRTDRTLFRPGTGVWYSLLSKTGTAAATSWGVSTDVDVPADYDGDGKADLAIWRPSTGQWYIIQSATNTVRVDSWGVSGDIALAGDVDADGKADLVIWRPSTGTWFAKKSTGGTQTANWGISTDKPFLGDYDSDGKADFTIFRPSSGVWFLLLSTGGSLTVPWGVSTDMPLVGDWDGDDKDDLGVFRPSSGQWFIIKNAGGGTIVVNWGVSGDIPLAGDQDGDGKSDFILWRPSTGVWFTQFANGSTAGVLWGIGGDRPSGRQPGT